METYAMLLVKKPGLTLQAFHSILICAGLALFLTSCDVTTSCSMQAMAGGAQYCEETSAED